MVNNDSNAFTLNWVLPITVASADMLITETLKLTDLATHSLISGRCITFELTGDDAVFQPSDNSDNNTRCDSSEKSKKCSHCTDILGRVYSVINPIKNINNLVTINAYLTDNPSVKAQPLTLMITSKRKVKALEVTPKHSQQHINVWASIVATVLDMNDAPYPGQTVHYSADNDAMLLINSGITDNFGQAGVDVVGVRPGEVTVTGMIDEQSDFGTIDFVNHF